MQKTRRKHKMKVEKKEHWDEKPDNICYCGYPFDGRPHNSPRCQPPVRVVTEPFHIILDSNGEPLNT